MVTAQAATEDDLGGFIVDDDAAEEEEVPVPIRRRGALATGAPVNQEPMLDAVIQMLLRLQGREEAGDASASRLRLTRTGPRLTRARRSLTQNPSLSARCTGVTPFAWPQLIPACNSAHSHEDTGIDALKLTLDVRTNAFCELPFCCLNSYRPSRWRRRWSRAQNCSCRCCHIRRNSWPGL